MPTRSVTLARNYFGTLNRAVLWFIWIAAAGLTAAYVVVVPIAAAEHVGSCGGMATLRIAKEGGSDEKTAAISRQIVGSTAKYLFVRDPADGALSALATDIVKAVSMGLEGASTSGLCLLVQM